MTTPITLFCFRQDLRLSDNPGLCAAAQRGTVLPVYVFDDSVAELKMGGASLWWLHHSLAQLNASLNNQLNIYKGNTESVLLEIIKNNHVDAVYWNRCYEPARIFQDSTIKAKLKSMDIECKSFNGSLLFEPWEILKHDGKPYQVFTPYYRNGCLPLKPRMPLNKPKNLTCLRDPHQTNSLNALDLLPKIKWDTGIADTWQVGERAAHKKLQYFFDHGLRHYKTNRDYPDKPNVSRLSPHLHFGEISPQQIWHSANIFGAAQGQEQDIADFLRQIVWREFSYYLLYHHPSLPIENFNKKFNGFPWVKNPRLLKAWQQGRTGYPIVDAGMRELRQTGYMHNRVRMIVASFLVKNLRIHWHEGAAWFWDNLVDADLANNSASWQWVAGSGADAAPYFRIFNPIIQGEKFDKQGLYTRKFVPELAKIPDRYLFKPWEAPSSILLTAGIELGKTYPLPIVDLKQSRDLALDAYKNLKSKNDNYLAHD